MSISSFGGGGFQAFGISASGIRDATLRLNVAANNIANANTDGFVPDRVSSSAVPGGGVDSYIESGESDLPDVPATNGEPTPSQTDLVTEFVNVIVAKSSAQANAKMLKVQKDVSQSLIDAIG